MKTVVKKKIKPDDDKLPELKKSLIHDGEHVQIHAANKGGEHKVVHKKTGETWHVDRDLGGAIPEKHWDTPVEHEQIRAIENHYKPKLSLVKTEDETLDKGLGSKLDNAEHKAKISQALGSIRQPAKVTNAAGETKMVSPAEQVAEQKSVKANKASEAKAKAEAEAAARRASYKK